MPNPLIATLVALPVLALGFWTVERCWPARAQPRWRRDTPTDVAYWFLTPLVTKAIARAAVVVAVVLLALAAGVRPDGESIRAFAAHGRGSLAQRQPVWLQAIEVVLIGDFIGYWVHRLFHGRALWRIHAVHHSSERLDWLSSVRLHPLNDVGTRLAQAVPLFALGFDGPILAAYVPFLSLYAILLHANVSWDFGPLRHVLASPRFHQWHHTSEAEGLDTNFAGFFPFWDALFGTLYLPRDREPQAFGLANETVPAGLLGQLAYPFRRRARAC
jgi:sterol desaturase/sphingolipid hydroxylase (fatty acid hydroxylase superfamily)